MSPFAFPAGGVLLGLRFAERELLNIGAVTIGLTIPIPVLPEWRHGGEAGMVVPVWPPRHDASPSPAGIRIPSHILPLLELIPAEYGGSIARRFFEPRYVGFSTGL
jgi:hypothetical protein